MELELEKPMSRKAQTDHNLNRLKDSGGLYSTTSNQKPPKTISSSDSSDQLHDLCRRSNSLEKLDMEVPAACDSAEKKLEWLISQIIGEDEEFDSPFGKRRLIYADNTASGRSLLYIENSILTKVLPFYGNTHTCDSYVGHRTTKMVKEATTYIKKCLGGTREDALLFCGSGTTSSIKRLQEVMGITVPSILRERVIKSLRNEERWVVFVGPYEHHSNLLSWRQSLAEVVEIGLDENGLLDMEALRVQLEHYKFANRPILGSFSACSNVTGNYSDTRAVAQLLHQYGAFACFDFAASGPYVKIDMRSGEIDGYDAIFLSVHKFLGGPGSPGVLLMTKALYQLKSSPPSTCGGGTVNYVNPFNEKDTLYFDDIEERENAGTPQITQIIRAALAFWIKEYISYPLIEKQEQNYIKRALDRLAANKNIWVLGNTSVKRQAILSFLIYSTTNSPYLDLDCTKDGFKIERKEERVGELCIWGEMGNKKDKPLHGPFVASLLSDLFGIQARGGCSCAGPYGHTLLNLDESHSLAYRSLIQKGYVGVKPGWTRVSFPYYVSNDKFEFILAALEFIAVYGQRFLPLYSFNLRNGGWTLKKKALKNLVKKDGICHNVHRLVKEYDNAETKLAAAISKHAAYLEAAHSIANLLPKFPTPRKLPEDIYPDLLHFRV